MVDRLLLSSPCATLGHHQDLEQESQRRVREVETLEQQLSKAAMDTCLDKWICKDRSRGTWHFWSLKPRSPRDVYNILHLYIYAVMVHCDSMHLGILRLYLEWLGHLATYGRAFPKSWQIIQKHGESRKNMEIQGQWWKWRVLRCILHVSTLRIRTKSGSAAQRRSRNFNLGSPKRPQRLGSTSTAAWSGQVFDIIWWYLSWTLDITWLRTISCPRVPEEEGLRDAFI